MDEQATGSWFTYTELGEQLGISAEAARAVARRHKWPRQQANAVGRVVRVLVPADRIRPDSANGQSKNGHRPHPNAADGHDGTSQQVSPDSANGQTDNGQWPNPDAFGRD